MIVDIAKLKEDYVCKDGNVIPSGTEFSIDEKFGTKYRCFSDPANDFIYMVYIEGDLIEVIGKTNLKIDEYFQKFL
jgi:hypothetical protein